MLHSLQIQGFKEQISILVRELVCQRPKPVYPPVFDSFMNSSQMLSSLFTSRSHSACEKESNHPADWRNEDVYHLE